jgi:hypothetical protein
MAAARRHRATPPEGSIAADLVWYVRRCYQDWTLLSRDPEVPETVQLLAYDNASMCSQALKSAGFPMRETDLQRREIRWTLLRAALYAEGYTPDPLLALEIRAIAARLRRDD